MKITFISKILVALLWVSTLVVAVCWIFWKNAPFEPEPITVVLGLISTAVTALVSEYGSRLEEEEFSLPYALAYGYVNNFVEPLITQLLKNISPGAAAPRLYIYIPTRLSELESKSIALLIAKMRLRNFKDNVINLEFRDGRARDVLTITKSNNEQVYFDFPNTLLSLNSLIEYKTESKKNSFDDAGKEIMSKNYISKFREVTIQLIRNKNLDKFVFFAGEELEF